MVLSSFLPSTSPAATSSPSNVRREGKGRRLLALDRRCPYRNESEDTHQLLDRRHRIGEDQGEVLASVLLDRSSRFSHEPRVDTIPPKFIQRLLALKVRLTIGHVGAGGNSTQRQLHFAMWCVQGRSRPTQAMPTRGEKRIYREKLATKCARLLLPWPV